MVFNATFNNTLIQRQCNGQKIQAMVDKVLHRKLKIYHKNGLQYVAKTNIRQNAIGTSNLAKTQQPN
jgi:hypothetical protein